MTQESESASGPRQGSGAMFDGIAGRYDLLNRIISFGIDQGWRRKEVAALELPEGGRVLDLATGTADVAIAVAEAHPSATIVGVDPSEKMLEVGRTKIEARTLSDRVSLEVGDAQALRFADASFEGITMAFGIRNVPDRDKALREMARVLVPGGRVAILELSEPRGGIFSSLARIHVHHVVPFVGGLLSGQKEYGYLQRSIAAFPPAEEFGERITQAGLELCEIVSLTMGVAHLYVARRPVQAG